MSRDEDVACNFQCIFRSVNVRCIDERGDGDHAISLHFHRILRQCSNVGVDMGGKAGRNVGCVNFRC